MMIMLCVRARALAWMQWHVRAAGMSGYSGVLLGGLEGIKTNLGDVRLTFLLSGSGGLIVSD